MCLPVTKLPELWVSRVFLESYYVIGHKTGRCLLPSLSPEGEGKSQLANRYLSRRTPSPSTQLVGSQVWE